MSRSELPSPASRDPNAPNPPFWLPTRLFKKTTAGSPVLVALLVGAWLFRVLVAIFDSHVDYPDETFQYLEQAHRVIFGYGQIPWEYQADIRNWLFPGFLALLLSSLNAIGLGEPEYYAPAIRIIVASFSLVLVIAAQGTATRIAGEKAGLMALVLVGFWYEIVLAAPRATPETIAAVFWMSAMYCVVARFDHRRAFLIGCLLALTAGLRPQYVPALALLVIPFYSNAESRMMCTAFAIGGIIVAGLAFGLADFIALGTPFISYVNNVRANVLMNVASGFGEDPFYTYLLLGLGFSQGLYLVAVVFGLKHIRLSWIPLLSAVILVGAHSLLAHKEYRFVFAALPLLLVTLGIGLSAEPYGTSRLRLYGGLLLALSLAGALHLLPIQLRDIRRDWGVAEFRSLLKTVREAPDARAILVTSPAWYLSGGYFYFHRDIPFFGPYAFSQLVDPDWGVQLSITHTIVQSGTPTMDGFSTIMVRGPHELRQRDNIVTDAPRPSISSVLVFDYVSK